MWFAPLRALCRRIVTMKKILFGLFLAYVAFPGFGDISFMHIGHWEGHKDVTVGGGGGGPSPVFTVFVDGQVSIIGNAFMTSDSYVQGTYHGETGSAYYGPGAVLSIWTESSPPIVMDRGWTNVQIRGGPNADLVRSQTTGAASVHQFGLTGGVVTVNLQQVIDNENRLYGDYTLILDDVAPWIGPSYDTGTLVGKTGWYTKNITVNAKFSVDDDKSGVEAGSVAYLINGEGWKGVGPGTGGLYYIPARTFSDGIHTISERANDNVKNARSVSQTFQVDTHAPVFAPGDLVAVISGGDETHPYGTLSLSWPAADDPVVNGVRSGFTGYDLSINNGQYTQHFDNSPGHTAETSVVLSTFLATFYASPRSLDGTLTITLTARDLAGNTTVLPKSVLLPKQIAIGTGVSAELKPTTVNPNPFSNTLVKLPLNVTPEEFYENYTSVVLKRGGGNDLGTNLDQIITIDPKQIVGSSFQIIDSSGHWGTYWVTNPDNSTTEYLEYRETLGPSMGIGGKAITYTVASETITGQSGSEVGGGGQTPKLPAHPGTMAVTILDSGGRSVLVQSDGTVAGDARALVADATGMVQLSFQGTGIDQDDWQVDVGHVDRRAYKDKDNNDVIVDAYVYYDGNAGVSYPYDPATYNAETHRYPSKTVPITLAYGVNDIKLRWVQKADSRTVYYSQIIELTFTKSLDNGYTLSLTTPGSPTVDSTGSGAIVTAPGQLLEFSITSPDPTDNLSAVGWDFGDGEIGQSGAVKHKYHQVAGQLAATVSHTITISGLPGVLTDPRLDVVVQDTKDGPLYENEVWNGPHEITGNVIVPASLSLTIGTRSDASTVVTFTGGLAAGLGQGLTVEGQMAVGSETIPVAFGPDPTNPSATGEPWGTILITGSATIANTLITGADRGVTVGAGSSVSLVHSQLTGNDIGLHVFGLATVSGSTITNNSGYGVKEDGGGRPVMTDNGFSGNGVDYYREGVTLFSLSKLNQLPGNSGNYSGNQ